MLAFLIIGLVSALFMFAGDMLLYFTKEKMHPDGTFAPVIEVMKKVSYNRLTAGGAIGPVAAAGYCAGFYSFVLCADASARPFAAAAFAICSLGMIIGGAYHSQCAYLGLIGKTGEESSLSIVTKNITTLSAMSTAFTAAGLLIFGALVLLGRTEFPRIFVLLTPVVTYFLRYLWKRLPQPLYIILYGGWSNLMFAVFYVAAIVTCAVM